MALNRRRFTQTLLGLMGTALMPVSASATELVQGRDWRAISPPQPSGNPGEIEVIEFFSYGCPHCMDLNPVIKPWGANLPADVTFKQVPVTFGRAAWANLARLYYALEYSGDLERLDQAVFEALHQDRIKLFTERDIFKWVESQGVDLETFEPLFNSFAVETQIKRSDSLVQRYDVTAVPMIAVDGRFVVVGNDARTFADLLVIADALIDKARDQPAVG
ncbi:twin-arginine translocation pathway signal protein [Thiocapsa imhoffii]|uniref:Thiol:disulfide interchange protein n=1 Tax=Thiocapsa imhoffii TaxID=382777 RepID=A0A9X1B7X4_9GAMM|nr:thiol:disulfide interchange protein DsbA/DsbL [Thiocapsa imhoffii]MBK1644177.1 twin-arginine translocation pathway signal protein [Thiocapsa imhoffii]